MVLPRHTKMVNQLCSVSVYALWLLFHELVEFSIIFRVYDYLCSDYA